MTFAEWHRSVPPNMYHSVEEIATAYAAAVTKELVDALLRISNEQWEHTESYQAIADAALAAVRQVTNGK
jgi:hypothetical protein